MKNMSVMRDAIVKSREEMLFAMGKELNSIDDWYIFYTHPYNPSEKDHNILVFPKRVTDEDFYGMIIDLILDYNDFHRESIIGNKKIKFVADILSAGVKGEKDLKKR